MTWWQWLLGLIESAICFAYVGWWKRTKARGLLHFWVTEDFAKRRARTECWWPETCLCSRKRCRQARTAKINPAYDFTDYDPPGIYRREQIIHGGMFCDICGGHGHLPYQCKKNVCRQCKRVLPVGQTDHLCMHCSMKDKLKAAYEDQQGKQPSRFDQRVLDGVATELADLYAIPAPLGDAPLGGDGLPHDDCRPCSCDTCSETRYRERQAKMTAHIAASQKWTNEALLKMQGLL